MGEYRSVKSRGKKLTQKGHSVRMLIVKNSCTVFECVRVSLVMVFAVVWWWTAEEERALH